ncbi:villin-1 [Periophthalmus magnuspinnatus]|uniref:villin-1 n=1 Tax=Periophthalmus magnuspinnatus TaxID=409849 RepID=UPI00145A220E|nr:villin-1 [Periophthalmus magnuspinnatus]
MAFRNENTKPWQKGTRPSLGKEHQHKLIQKMGDTKDVFRNVSQKPGLQIWTINNMEMVPVPPQAHGNFFEGDCYIVLNISKGQGQNSDIHYWIGNSSSQDEQGAAAIYVTQLDEHLGGSPVQHREVQRYESARFKSYFKNGLIYKKGGVASGFNHVEPNSYNVLRLLHVKGKKHVTASEVEVSWNSFNNGDIFLLDMGKAIVQWNGPKSNRGEKLKAVLLAQDIRDRERGGRAQIGVVEGGDEAGSPELMKIMTSVLGQRKGGLKSAIPDDQPDHAQKSFVRLYNVFEESGNLVIREVATQPLTQNLLRSTDCYIADQNGSCVMVWKGKQASPVERAESLNRAMGYIKTKNYPPSTSLEVMNEGGETAMFKHLFKSWKDKGQTQGLGTTHTVGKIAKVEQVKFDVMQLHARPDLAAQQRMVDDASGEVKIWRIEDLELAEVDPSTYGQFYGGDCYLVLYTYMRANKPQYILYMWQGRHATKDEITASAYQAVNIDNKYNGAPVQVRVTMGKEPRHFLAIFKGKLIIFEGGTGRAGVTKPEPGPRLFQVKGTNEFNTKATEVQAKASSLNSNDVFLLKTERACYLWYGKGCNGDEREMGKAVADVLSRQDKRVAMEGQEPAEFWVALGGKTPYANDKSLQTQEPQHSPRLFECSNQTGRFMITEVDDFTQCDLDETDVMLLDTWEEIFLWIGNLAYEYETKEAWNSAREYLRTHPAGRDPDTPICFVKQGREPLTFTGWFNAWDPQMWSGGSTYEQMKNKFSDETSVSQIALDLSITNLNKGPSEGGYRAPGGPVTSPQGNRLLGGNKSSPTSPTSHRSSSTSSSSFTSSGSGEFFVDPQLLINKPAEELPSGVDPSLREEYLSDADFESVLGTTRADFQRLPKWRQNDMKKKAGLF